MIETHRLNVVIFLQTILSFVLSRTYNSAQNTRLSCNIPPWIVRHGHFENSLFLLIYQSERTLNLTLET